MVLLKSHDFSNSFAVRPLTEVDIPAILKLYETNPYYFEHCPPPPTEACVLDDMTKLPPGKRREDKHFVGYFDKDKLIAVLDLVEGYPSEEKAFIGLFMLDKAYQGKGLGSQLIVELLESLMRQFKILRLGYVATNSPAKAFWEKQGFVPTGETSQEKQYTIILAEYLKKDK
ncbi:N-acetyltransferase domain-containing protein [Streptococcus pluranimalium]|uniref:GNAT family N-acetyltransferase n=1 Tax=Streptococcus pluranimalium TaxID=82348 RepID=UPI0039EB6599